MHTEHIQELDQLLQDLEPETLARVINDLSYHDPEFYGRYVKPLVENLWWLEDEEIDMLARELKAYSTADLIKRRWC